jgi:tripartite-type tricarboxylate transporter receptor subunit TctC
LTPITRFCLPFAAFALLSTQVLAQFPERAVTLVVPSAPGTVADTSARLIASKLIERWGRAVLVENKPGTAAEFVAKEKPDGHVLLVGSVGGQAIQPSLHKKLPYDPERAFAPISLVAEIPLVLLVHPSVKANAPRDLVTAAAKAKPPLKYASSGNGSMMHIAAVLFESATRIQLAHVPEKSDEQAISDLVSGNVTLAFAPLPEAIGHITAGKVRALAVTSAKRAAALPRLQTVAESGFPGYEAASWIGILAPAGTPAPAIEKISKDVQRAVAAPDVRQKLDQQGAIAVGSSPAQFKARIDSDRERYARLIQERGITPG